MGLRPLKTARWLEVDRQRAATLAEKGRLLCEVHDRVVASLPGSEPAGAELLVAVLDNLDRHHPGTVTRHPDATVEDCTTGHIVDTRGLHPVDAAGRLVAEDLCVMEQVEGAWTMTAASLCFPSRWTLAAKLGRDITAIHAPVPGFGEALARPTANVLNRLRTDRPVWRLNWTLIDRPDLHQPDPAGRRSPPPLTDPGRELWFRVERQTLRRLTDRPAITFTIRTYVTSLADLLIDHPETAAALRTALSTVPDETIAYKGWEGVVDPVLAWLDSIRARPHLLTQGSRRVSVALTTLAGFTTSRSCSGWLSFA